MNLNELLEGFEYVYIIRVALSLLLGALIGYERTRRNKSAGVVTHMLVSIGATILTIVQLEITNEVLLLNQAAGTMVMNTDPTRMVAQIISGIGFIGAGAIFKTDSHITGITTAATLWVSAILGISVGFGYYSLSVLSTILILCSMFYFKEHRKKGR